MDYFYHYQFKRAQSPVQHLRHDIQLQSDNQQPEEAPAEETSYRRLGGRETRLSQILYV